MEVKAEIVQALHRILRQKSELEQQVARGPRRIQLSQHAETQANTQSEAAQQELKRLKLAAADKQLQLKQRETKLEDLKGKRNACKSNREFTLLNDQIAADQQANTVLADEILDLLESVDRQAETIQSANAAVAAARAESAKVREDVERKAAVLQTELARINAELRDGEAELPASLRGEYKHRVQAMGEEALAAVEDESCGNCHQLLSPHVLDQLSMGRVHFCSSCNAILYHATKISV
jgi:predicted  nucleic acid-binding Zn-ribbon protein